jgi:ribosomal protein S25
MPETKQVKLKIMYGKARQINIIKRDLFISKEVRENMDKAVPKMRYITPTELSGKYGIKVSAAKEYLANLEQEHVIQRADAVKDDRLLVYVPVYVEKAKSK